jgi:hypothetical protein
LSYHVPGQKPDGGATGHDKRAGRDPKFDDYTQHSSDLHSKFKNQYQNNSKAYDILQPCEILAKIKDLPGA